MRKYGNSNCFDLQLSFSCFWKGFNALTYLTQMVVLTFSLQAKDLKAFCAYEFRLHSCLNMIEWNVIIILESEFNQSIHAFFFFQSMMKILLNKITGNEVVEDFEAVEDVEAGVDGKISFEIFFMKLNANFKNVCYCKE